MKKSSGIILGVVVILLLIVMGVGGYILISKLNKANTQISKLENGITLSKVDDSKNEKIENTSETTTNSSVVTNNNRADSPSEINKNTAETTNSTSTKNVYTLENMKGTYEKKEFRELSDGTKYDVSYRLELNDDGTFVYYVMPDTDCHVIGYYTIKDNVITLNSLLAYGNDPSITAIDDKNTVTIIDFKTLLENKEANGKLTKTSNIVKEKINVADSIKKAVKSQYFSVED